MDSARSMERIINNVLDIARPIRLEFDLTKPDELIDFSVKSLYT
jgi:hypothetical protein